jgi:ferredoxin
MTLGNGSKAAFARSDLDLLVGLLRGEGYRVIGPKSDGAAIIYDELDSAADLPKGWTDTAEAGAVRAEKTEAETLFGYSLGVQGWKRFLYPPKQKLFSAERAGTGFRLVDQGGLETPMAFLGVRGCELAAIRVQDTVFSANGFAEPGYQGRRRDALIIAVECARAVSTCFCASAGSGPAVGSGYDILLNELDEGFIAEAGTPRGEALLAKLPLRPASTEEVELAEAQPLAAAAQQSRTMAADAKDILARNLNNPHWSAVAERCLTCGNCTMVCPTCFCTTVEDTTDLSGNHAERWRIWDSCFTIDYAHIAGGSLRNTGAARYRQWITHKLSTWHGQFGHSGCIGCGRCIAWCPVGIDITEEVRAISESE